MGAAGEGINHLKNIFPSSGSTQRFCPIINPSHEQEGKSRCPGD